MPYEGPGVRHTATATKVVRHGRPCVENGFPGSAFKVEQMGRFTDPSLAASAEVGIGEEFEIQVGGIHEVAGDLIPGGAAAAPVGTRLWIREDSNAVVLTPTVGTNEVQTVTVPVTATGGTWTLTFDGETTAAIAFNATAAVLQQRLEALSNLDPGDVVVSGGGAAGTAYTITFTGDLAGDDVPAITTSGANLTPATQADPPVTTGTPGAPGAGVVKFGRVTEHDTTRTPNVVRVNGNARDTF